ncbi:hypothetical protein AB0F91_09000 [Amycolatopsis sp. NPDC023774]|uniref:hypothetical protein n=1 Tax=Amycolatopsis sp. NPDC023774 TaxID=3155015 RepID=UPI0033D3FFC6
MFVPAGPNDITPPAWPMGASRPGKASVKKRRLSAPKAGTRRANAGPGEIASTGQAGSQLPQLMHSNGLR